MPTVPQYDLPSVEMSSGQAPAFTAPGVQPMADVAGKQIQEQGQTMLKAGLALKKLGDDINFDLAEAGAKQDTNKLSDEIRNIVVEYGKLNGKEAVDNREKYIKQVEDKITAISDENANSDQPKGYLALRQQLFTNAANARRQVATGQIDSHYLPQLKNWQIGESKAAIHNSINDAAVAASDWQNPAGNFAKFKGTLIINVDDLAVKSGLTKIDEKTGEKVADTESPQYKELMRTSLTALHTDVIRNFVAKDQDGMAAAYLKANKSEIAADKLDELTKLIGENGTATTSLNIARQLTGTLSEQVAAVDKMYADGKINQKVYDSTIARVEHNWHRSQTVKSEWEKGLIGNAQAWLDANKDKTAEDLPAQVKLNLQNSGHWATIKGYAKNGRFENDPKTWGEIVSMPQSTLAEMTPSQFYTRYRGKLDDAHLEQGIALLNNSRGDTKNPNTIQIVTTNEMVSRAAKEAKIIPFKGQANEDQQKNLGLFESAVQREVDSIAATLPKGQKPSNTEVQRAIDKVLLDKVKIDEFGRDPEKPMLFVRNDPKAMQNAYVTVNGRDIYLSKIPTMDQEKYTQKLRSAGIPVTQRKLAELWAADNPQRK